MNVEGLHSLGEAQLAGEKFDKAVDTYKKAKRKTVSVEWFTYGPEVYCVVFDTF